MRSYFGAWKRTIISPVTRSTSSPSSSAGAEFRIQILSTLINTASENYKEFARIASVIDDKAQKTITTAGIFLGAAFAFIKPEGRNIRDSVGLLGLGLLASTITGLLMSTVFSLLVVRVRSTPIPLTAKALEKMRQDLFHLDDSQLSSGYREGFLGEQIAIWLATLDSFEQVIASKAAWLWRSQLALAISMSIVAILLIMVLNRSMIS